MNYLSIIGLVFNVVGSFIFIMDSNRLSKILSKMVAHMAGGHGKLDSKKFEKDELQALNDKISASKKITRFGYMLFFGGFVLQLIAAICNQ